MSSPWATLTLNARAHQALSLDEMSALSARLVDLHARVGVRGHPTDGWDLQVSSWANGPDGPLHMHRAFDLQGHLADLIANEITEYERRFVWTPDELLAVAAQSGIEVRRA